MADHLIFETGFFMSPNEIFDREDLSSKEKLIFLYLCRCSNNGSAAFPSYNTIGAKTSISRKTVIETVKMLVDKGLLEKKERVVNGENTSNIYRIVWGGSHKVTPPPVSSLHHPSVAITPYKELPTNNSPIKKETLPRKRDDAAVVEIIEYLNQRAEKNFSPKTKETLRFIEGRLNEGRTVEDFKHVIDVKVSQWKNDEKMDSCLRPSTLFRPSNFEAYLQERIKDKSAKPAGRRETLPFEPDYRDLPQPPEMI